MKQENRNQLHEWLRKGAPSLLVVILGVAFYMALEHFSAVSAVIGKIYSVCAPFVVGAILAFLMDGPVRYFENKFHWKRTPTVWGVFLSSILLFILMLVGFVPQLVDSTTQLVKQIPDYMVSLETLVGTMGDKYSFDTSGIEKVLGSYSDVVSQAADYVGNAVPQILDYSIKIGNGVLQAVEAVMASMYILLSKKSLMRQMKKLNYAIFPLPVAKRLSRIFHHTCRAFIGFFNGKIIDSLIIGIISFVVLSILRMPYVLLLSVVIGVTNIIPFFGPFIGAIPNTMILFIIDPILAVEYVIFTLILQQFDGNVLGPRILGDSIGLPALWVLVSIVVAGGLFGFAGMLLGVPIFAVLYTLIREWTNDRLGEKHLDADGNSTLQPVGVPVPVPQEGEKPAAQQ